MGKNELKQLQIIDITQLQQKNVGVISSNDLAEIAHIWPFGQKFNPVGGIQTLIDYAENSHGYIVYTREQLV